MNQRPIVLLSLLAAVSAVSTTSARAELVRDERVKMAAPMSITIDAPSGSEEEAHATIDAAYDEVDRLVHLLSEWDPTSDVSRVNDAAGSGKSVVVAPETFAVIERAKEIGDITQGGFDITFLPVGRLWDFKRTPPVLPPPGAIARAKALVNYRKIALDPATHAVALRDSGMAIGLGGIAQGTIVDRVASMIRQEGFANFVVDVSGDLRVDGIVNGHPWRVGIQHPRDRSRTIATVPIAGGLSIVTSGDYEHYFDLGGRRYHHIIDPKTGYPTTGCQSVTIVSRITELADALATGIFVMGPERGLALAERLPDVEALIVDAKGDVHTTTGFQLEAPPAVPAVE